MTFVVYYHLKAKTSNSHLIQAYFYDFSYLFEVKVFSQFGRTINTLTVPKFHIIIVKDN
jgi:hypothetical protein